MTTPHAGALGSAPPPVPPLVMVVDDDSCVRFAVSDSLRAHNYRVIEAHNGSQALEILPGLTDLSIVVTDLMMPAISGLSLIQTLSEDYPRVRVLAVTGHPFAEATEMVRGLYVPVLLKPFGMHDLIEYVELLSMCSETRHRRGNMAIDDVPGDRQFSASVVPLFTSPAQTVPGVSPASSLRAAGA